MKHLYTLSALAVVAALAVSPAIAGEKSKTVTKTEDGRIIDRTIETKRGTVSSHNEITKTGDKTWSGTRTITGPDGKTRTITTEGTKTEDGFEKTQTWTGKDGETKTRHIEHQRNDDGTVTRSVTDPKGETHTSTGQNGHEARKNMRQERRDGRREHRQEKRRGYN